MVPDGTYWIHMVSSLISLPMLPRLSQHKDASAYYSSTYVLLHSHFLFCQQLILQNAFFMFDLANFVQGIFPTC